MEEIFTVYLNVSYSEKIINIKKRFSVATCLYVALKKIFCLYNPWVETGSSLKGSTEMAALGGIKSPFISYTRLDL